MRLKSKSLDVPGAGLGEPPRRPVARTRPKVAVAERPVKLVPAATLPARSQRSRKVGTQTAAEVQARGVKAPVSPEQVARAVELNYRGSKLRTVEALMGFGIADLHLGPLAKKALADPELLGVLAGVLPSATITIPAPAGTPRTAIDRAKIEVAILIERLRISTADLELSLPSQPEDGNKLTVYRTNPPVGDPEPEMRALREALAAGAIPPRKDTPRSVKQVGLIAFTQSAAEVKDLVDALKIWDENFLRFGHQGMTLRLLDDSPEPYAGQIKRFVQSFRPRSGAKIMVLGRQEKEAVRRDLIARVAASPEAKALIAQGTIQAADIAPMVHWMFGSPERSGPTEARNLSMLLFGGKPAFQADHDQTPQALVFDEIAAAHNTFVASYEQTKDLYPAGAEHNPPVVVPVDVLGYFERWGRDSLVSPQFSGGADLQVHSLILEVPPPSAVGTLKGDSFVLRQPNLHRPEVFILSRPGERRDMGTRAPMFVPARAESGPTATAGRPAPPTGQVQYPPFVMPVRNGDIFLGEVMECSGVPFSPCYLPIFHREAAGSKWGPRAKLLYDDMISNAASAVVRQVLDSFDPMTPVDLTQTGRALLELSAKLGADEPAQQALRANTQEAFYVADAAAQANQAQQARLATIRFKLTGVDARDRVEGLARWLFHRELTEPVAQLVSGSWVQEPALTFDQACDKARALIASNPKILATELKRVDLGLAQSAERIHGFRDIFHLADELVNAADTRSRAVSLLSKEMEPTIAAHLKAYGLSLLLKDAILTAPRAGRLVDETSA